MEGVQAVEEEEEEEGEEVEEAVAESAARLQDAAPDEVASPSNSAWAPS